ncbi:MAG: DUF4390 domain-containing protein [Gammaproteobacteria bacterium]|nr:DUF4390 domain-containing protein [Gammaproteobacteria bacterium]MBU1507291.1 DUF4390 domain-containing protein [Gammaproteobacteria bacterium]MBU2120874.1 DUF4390 domain-containing protein [Gammaproteobacteria bacterium]MBU2169589.1 DUF4390 domain-containing protein [Gammaproteobacteria bacterium]MBU2201740.1 DUF4390 domain-containing protein [Gammaproteobacteria bacterium]
MTTTDFFTHCCKNRLNEFRRAHWVLIRTLICLLACITLAPPAGATEAAVPEVSELRLDRTDDGLYLGTTMQFVLPELAEDALYKGIPMFFVAEAQVLRDRWYWSDRQVTETTRYLRLSYQPLTRRWRLNVSPAPFSNSGLGVVLGQNFDEYSEALSAIQRISRWKIAEAGEIEADAVHTVNFRFRLDMSQLPRPFQIGAVGRSGWNLLVSRSQRLPAEAAK